MEQLKQLNKVVKEVLEDKPETRKSDIKLIMEVFKRKGINTSESFATLAQDGQLGQMESITRARRKVQSDYPELKDDNTAAFTKTMYVSDRSAGMWRRDPENGDILGWTECKLSLVEV